MVAVSYLDPLLLDVPLLIHSPNIHQVIFLKHKADKIAHTYRLIPFKGYQYSYRINYKSLTLLSGSCLDLYIFY